MLIILNMCSMNVPVQLIWDIVYLVNHYRGAGKRKEKEETLNKDHIKI
jgi:hypothetical protein